MTAVSVVARPGPVGFETTSAALILIDMQRDFLEPGGFGESLGNDVSQLRGAVEPCRRLLQLARAAGLRVVHTREGHRTDLADALAERLCRGEPGRRIGDAGPMGRILVRGEPGHALIGELAPRAGEPVIDKPGKGAFCATDLDLILRSAGIRTLLVGGVTTEVCVHSTVREANDRGYRCIVVGDACASYFPEFHRVGLEMIAAQGGIFGAVTTVDQVAVALQPVLGAST